MRDMCKVYLGLDKRWSATALCLHKFCISQRAAILFLASSPFERGVRGDLIDGGGLKVSATSPLQSRSVPNYSGPMGTKKHMGIASIWLALRYSLCSQLTDRN
jgi:hypothetical protein